MGTNYYLKPAPCETCGHSDYKKHIGKSSFGWQFHFRSYCDNSILCYSDWLREFEDTRKVIVNEYGDLITVEQFKKLVEEKKDGINHYNVSCGYPVTEKEIEYCKQRQVYASYYSPIHCWKDSEGHTFTGVEFC